MSAPVGRTMLIDSAMTARDISSRAVVYRVGWDSVLVIDTSDAVPLVPYTSLHFRIVHELSPWQTFRHAHSTDIALAGLFLAATVILLLIRRRAVERVQYDDGRYDELQYDDGGAGE